jgi:hypothetical protein
VPGRFGARAPWLWQKRSLLITVGLVVTLMAVITAPAWADNKVKIPADPTLIDCGGELILKDSVEGWSQVNSTGGRSGIFVMTWHQTHTYTNPNTGESVVIQNTGVAKITDQGVRGAGIDDFGQSSINHGWQDFQAGTVKGHLVDLCEVLG